LRFELTVFSGSKTSLSQKIRLVTRNKIFEQQRRSSEILLKRKCEVFSDIFYVNKANRTVNFSKKTQLKPLPYTFNNKIEKHLQYPNITFRNPKIHHAKSQKSKTTRKSLPKFHNILLVLKEH
jgi:hypothetical protein